MTTKKERQLDTTRRTSRIIDRADPKVRLLALVVATRDDEVRQGTLTGEAGKRVPPTIARAVAKMLREMGEDAELGKDLVMTIGPEMGDPESRRTNERFVARLSETLLQENPEDPLQGMTVVVQRRAQSIVGKEAAAVRRRASSSGELPPPAAQRVPTTRTSKPTRRLTRTETKTKAKGRRVVQTTTSRSRVPAALPPQRLTEVFMKAMAAALRRLAAAHGPAFNQLTFLEAALEGYQCAWSLEKRKSTQGLDAQALREFERQCGATYGLLREEAVALGVPDASFTIDDMHRIIKSLVQRLGLVIESAGGHVRLKVQAGRKTGH